MGWRYRAGCEGVLMGKKKQKEFDKKFKEYQKEMSKLNKRKSVFYKLIDAIKKEGKK